MGPAQQRQHGGRSQSEADGQEGEDGRARHRVLDHDEGRTPDGGDEEENKVGSELATEVTVGSFHRYGR